MAGFFCTIPMYVDWNQWVLRAHAKTDWPGCLLSHLQPAHYRNQDLCRSAGFIYITPFSPSPPDFTWQQTCRNVEHLWWGPCAQTTTDRVTHTWLVRRDLPPFWRGSCSFQRRTRGVPLLSEVVMWCLLRESNPAPWPFWTSALPTKLQRLKRVMSKLEEENR